MKFIITVCDEKGHELGMHEQVAEPHFAHVSEIVTFDLKSFHVAMTRELYEKLAERKEEGQTTKNGINTAWYVNMLTYGKKMQTLSIVQHPETIVLTKLHMILKRKKMKISDEIYIHGYVDEIRKDCVIIRNDGGYFGTVESEIVKAENIVPVIRCKDCLYWRNYCRVVDSVTSHHVCGRKRELDGTMHRSKANDFCSWAERKEEGD